MKKKVSFVASVALVLSAACGAPVTPTETEAEQTSELGGPALGSGSVFARIPNPPGYPEGIVVVDDRVFVSGPARLGTAGSGPSQILIFDLDTGAARGSITVAGEVLAAEHALSCITSDSKDRLYVLSTQLGVLRFTRSGSGYTQSVYAPLPANLPVCAPGVSGPCSPTVYDGPPLVNDLAFDRGGNLYVTDSFQATVWRVPPGGGTPQVWFQSSALAAPPFAIGVNGVRVSPDNQKVYLTVSISLANPAVGYVYSVSRASPSAGNLAAVHTYSAGEGPDGIAFSLLGRLFVALAGANGISELAPNGQEVRRYLGPAGSAIPYDGPANIAFDRCGSLLVTNHAIVSNDATHFAVLKVFVAALPSPLFKP